MPEEIRCWNDLERENRQLRIALKAAAEAIDALAKCNATTDEERHREAMRKIAAWSHARFGIPDRQEAA